MMDTKDQSDQDIGAAFARMKRLGASSSPCPSEEMLAAYAEKRLHSSHTEAIEEHLASCSRCMDAVLFLSESLHAEAGEEYDGVSDAALNRARRLIVAEDERRRWTRFSVWLATFAPKPVWAVASAVVLITALALFYLPTGNQSDELHGPVGGIRLIASLPSGTATRGETPVYTDVEVKAGATLHSGDRFRIEFSLDMDGYAYLFMMTSSGSPVVLFPPMDKTMGEEVAAHAPVVLPDTGTWYALDDHTGDETIYLLTSATAIRDFHQEVSRLDASQISSLNGLFPDASIEAFSILHE